jgi:hypothetical protein
MSLISFPAFVAVGEQVSIIIADTCPNPVVLK